MNRAQRKARLKHLNQIRKNSRTGPKCKALVIEKMSNLLLGKTNFINQLHVYNNVRTIGATGFIVKDCYTSRLK